MQRIHKTTLFVALSAAALLAVGCNVSTTGDEGNILFTPDECGRSRGCDFEDSVDVGGAINVNISGVDGFSTVGITLESDDTDVLTVAAIGDVGGRPTWELVGVSPGVAGVVALDTNGDKVDSIAVAVQELSGLTMENVLGDAVGPSDDTEYDEHWIVNADQRVVFEITPLIGSAGPTMGRYVYTPFIESDAFDTYIADVDGLNAGRLDFTAPAGQYGVSFEDAYGHALSVLIDVQ